MTQKIRIAFVIDALHASTGGTEGQLLHLLRRLDRDRFDPVVYCLRSTPWLVSEFDLTEWEVLDIHVAPRPSLLRGIRAFSRELRRRRIDVVQTHFRDANVVGILAAWLARTPVTISTRRGVPYWNTRPGLIFLRWLNRRATWFIANSFATRNRFVRQEGLDPERVTVIYNGLEPERFRALAPDRIRELRTELGATEGAPLVGIVANLRGVKGIDDFVRAAGQVLAQAPDARFVIAGYGPEEQSLRELAASLKIADRVALLGSRDDIPDILQALDIAVLTSHFESFSNSILEYVVAGVPVVVTDVGGAREIVHDGVNGFIVPPRDADALADRLLRLIRAPGGPRAWLGEGRIDESLFLVRNMVDAHQELYEQLVRHGHFRGGSALIPEAPPDRREDG